MKEKEITSRETYEDMLRRAQMLVNSEDYSKWTAGMDLYLMAEKYAEKEGLTE